MHRGKNPICPITMYDHVLDTCLALVPCLLYHQMHFGENANINGGSVQICRPLSSQMSASQDESKVAVAM